MALVDVTLAAAAATASTSRHTLQLSLSCLGGAGWRAMLGSCAADVTLAAAAATASISTHAAALALMLGQRRLALDAWLLRS